MNIYELFSKRYKKTLKEETKQKRLAEIKEKIKEYKDEDFTIKEIIASQKEFLGYITYTDSKIKPSIGVITDIDGAYSTKWINIYYLKTGVIRQYKIKKQIIDELELKENDIINIKETEMKPKTIKTDEGWKQDWDNMQEHIVKINKVR